MGSCLSSESRAPLPGSPSSALVRKKKNPKKKGGSWSSSYESWRDETPGRLAASGASEFASLYTQQGKKGTNQDAMVVWENFCSRDDTIFCGVFDGHGPNGHLVARRVRDNLPQKLNAHWEVALKSEEVLREISLNSSSKNSEDMSFASAEEDPKAFVELNETVKQPDFFQLLKESFLKAFKVMDRDLRVNRSVDCFCSGTTAVTLIKQGRDLVIGNVGDSRAVLGTRDEDNSIVPVQLTVDLKPNLPAELERIRRCRGRVFSLQDEPDIARVWLPNCDSPGLAMARAFGDFCLKDYGLISIPEVSHRHLTERDEFIVLATDGIWDVLSNKEVVDTIASAPSRATAARTLVESAVRSWKTKYPTSKVDDCAAICLFLAKEKELIVSAEQAAEEGSSSPDGPGCSEMATTVKDILPDTSDDELAKDDENEADAETDWSALEGVIRVNTMVTLPRYVPGKGQKGTSGETKPFV